MGLAEEWKQLPGGTKMFIIGGGATAVFILIIALKGKNTATPQQQTTTQSTLDPTAWIDVQNQQMQSMQQLIQQNQQATQQQIQGFIDSMPKSSTSTAPSVVPEYVVRTGDYTDLTAAQNAQNQMMKNGLDSAVIQSKMANGFAGMRKYYYVQGYTNDQSAAVNNNTDLRQKGLSGNVYVDQIDASKAPMKGTFFNNAQ
jgi:hypothetical protein